MQQSHKKKYHIKYVGPSIVFAPNTPCLYPFVIVDESGNIVKFFKLERGKIIRTVLIRKDFNYFKYLYPEVDSEKGIFTLKEVLFPMQGEYRLFNQFVPLPTLISTSTDMPCLETACSDIMIGEEHEPVPMDSGERTKIFADRTVTLTTDPAPPRVGENILTFSLRIEEKELVNLEYYAGALAHLAVIGDDIETYIYAEAIEEVDSKKLSKISFKVSFPYRGVYKIFMEFKHNGEIVTTDFALWVE